MKKIFTMFAAMLCAGSMWASTATFNFAESGYYANEDEVGSISFGECSAVFDQGSSSYAPKYYDKGAAVRCYAGNTITIKSETAEPVTKIVLTYGEGDNSNPISSNVGTFDTDTWTGEANEIVLTIEGTSKHRRIAAITVTVGQEEEPITLDVVKFSAWLDVNEALWKFELDGGGWTDNDVYLYPDLVIYVNALDISLKIAGTYDKDIIVDLYGDIDEEYEFDFGNVVNYSALKITSVSPGFYRFEITFTTDAGRTFIIDKTISVDYAMVSNGSTDTLVLLEDLVLEGYLDMNGKWDNKPEDSYYRIIGETADGATAYFIYGDRANEPTGTYDGMVTLIHLALPEGDYYHYIVDYSFEVTQNEDGKYTAVAVIAYDTYVRFHLTIHLPFAQGIEDVLDGKNASKFIHDGRLFIEKNNVRYDATGKAIN